MVRFISSSQLVSFCQICPHSSKFFVLCCVHIYLTGILAPLWISSTHHAVSELSRIGVLAVVVRQDRYFYTLEVEWIKDCGEI